MTLTELVLHENRLYEKDSHALVRSATACGRALVFRDGSGELAHNPILVQTFSEQGKRIRPQLEQMGFLPGGEQQGNERIVYYWYSTRLETQK